MVGLIGLLLTLSKQVNQIREGIISHIQRGDCSCELPINLWDFGRADESQCQFCMHAAMESLAATVPRASTGAETNQ